ncbi:MAG: aerial mycelium formation protein [Actinobacteria bacterium]|nr:aerial mycelium formation protein [Actinomycetota bacterium]
MDEEDTDMTAENVSRRRLDRVMDEDYLVGLSERRTDEIRRMRDECEEEESGISYARRLLQGKLDILRAELLRRRDAGSERAASVLESLPSLLSDDGPTTSPVRARVPRFLVPPSVQHHRREVERVADDDVLATMGKREDDELAEIVESLSAKERELSDLRRGLLDRIDRLQDELAGRYKLGTADVAELLGG